MIDAHQASIFPPDFFVATSSAKNGSIRHPALDQSAASNLASWAADIGVDASQTVGLYVTYADDRTYTDIVEVDSPTADDGAQSMEGWVQADAFVTQAPGLALILPVADCNAVVYVDPVKHVLALAHIGWHSTVHNLASKLVAYMQERYGSDPADILIYNSPSIRADSYRFAHLGQTEITRWHAEPYAVLQADGRYAIDLLQYNRDQWAEAGIAPEHVEIIDVDTAKSEDYPSHFAGEASRFAVLAMIRP